MPVTNTITSTDFWTAGTRETITSTKWNNHMGIWRGHLLPVDGSTSAAANGSYDLGSSDHKWRNAHLSGTVYAKPGYSFSTITAALSITTQHIILCDASTAAYTCTLPAAANNTGTTFLFTKIDSGYNQITIDGNGAEQINDTATTTIATYGEMLELICDGVKWYKKSRYVDGTTRSFTPTGTWSTNVTFQGKISRSNRFAHITYIITASGACTTAALELNLPSGLSIDTSAFAMTNTGNPYFGNVSFYDFGSTIYTGYATYVNTTSVHLYASEAAVTYLRSSNVTGSVPFTFGSQDAICCTIYVPIVGWEA